MVPLRTWGLVHNHLPAPPIPVTETDADIAAARAEYERTNGQLMGPVFQGHYPEAFLRSAGADAPRVEPGDMERIALPTDFLGLNVYAGNFVRAGADGQPEVLDFPRGILKAHSGGSRSPRRAFTGQSATLPRCLASSHST